MDKTDYVGVYDSGIGGMTLLAECRKRMPWQNFYYFGDNMNAPYGQKSREEILSLSRRVMDRFAFLNVSAAVIACNTVTTECIATLRKEYPFPIIGTEPAVRLAADCKKILVLATAATLRSKEYEKLKNERVRKTVCFSPVNLVSEIEKNAPFLGKIGMADHLPEIDCDGVVLGCTHYVYLKKEIENFYKVPCFDGNEGTAKRLENVLISSKKPSSMPETEGDLVFLGNAKVVNAYLYKQMFSF